MSINTQNAAGRGAGPGSGSPRVRPRPDAALRGGMQTAARVALGSRRAKAVAPAKRVSNAEAAGKPVAKRRRGETAAAATAITAINDPAAAATGIALRPAPQPKSGSRGEPVSRRSPSAAGTSAAETSGRTSKKEACLSLLRRADGASIGELMEATGWQAHSVRGFLSGQVRKRLGLALTSTSADEGSRRYHIDDGAA
jgi:hypothetical protein